LAGLSGLPAQAASARAKRKARGRSLCKFIVALYLVQAMACPQLKPMLNSWNDP
jgi:hypothetical protein